MKKIEDIYPLTIVSMRYAGYAILNCEANSECVINLQLDEEINYEPRKYMEEKHYHIVYGIGKTLNEAFENYKFNKEKKLRDIAF